MIVLVTGGSRSGKSSFAEDAAVALWRLGARDACPVPFEEGAPRETQDAPLWYVATMHPWGADGIARVEHHRAQRANKGFTTVERYGDFPRLRLPGAALWAQSEGEGEDGVQGEGGAGGKACRKAGTVLLECLGNMVADQMYDDTGAVRPYDFVVSEVLGGLQALCDQAEHVVVVTNEVGADGVDYDEETVSYIRALGEVSARFAKRCDCVVESVVGIPCVVKGQITW